jgi:hypothetical protein
MALKCKKPSVAILADGMLQMPSKKIHSETTRRRRKRRNSIKA